MDCRGKMEAGRLDTKPLSLSRQDMMVAWTREGFFSLLPANLLGWM